MTYLFIDESGNTGCNGNATQYFIIAVIIFKKVEDL